MVPLSDSLKLGAKKEWRLRALYLVFPWCVEFLSGQPTPRLLRRAGEGDSHRGDCQSIHLESSLETPVTGQFVCRQKGDTGEASIWALPWSSREAPVGLTREAPAVSLNHDSVSG